MMSDDETDWAKEYNDAKDEIYRLRADRDEYHRDLVAQVTETQRLRAELERQRDIWDAALKIAEADCRSLRAEVARLHRQQDAICEAVNAKAGDRETAMAIFKFANDKAPPESK